MSELVELTIDGVQVKVPAGTSLLDAAKQAGITIPVVCHSEHTTSTGQCRLCVVENERGGLQAACVTAAAQGAVIQTRSEAVERARRTILEMLAYSADLTDSPEMEPLVEDYRAQPQRFAGGAVRQPAPKDDNPFYIHDHQYCILCGHCVRVCQEIVGASAIEFVGRGFHTEIGIPYDRPTIDSTCVFCGNCVQVCPTDSLLPVSLVRKGRQQGVEWVRTVCGYCGVGCEVEYGGVNGDILYARSPSDGTVNDEFLCSKGRYGWDFATNPERLTSPMIRRDLARDLGLTEEAWELPPESPLTVQRPKVEDYFVPVDWDTALDLVADRMARVVQGHGPDAVMGLASARCTNEENYLFQKFIRAGIGTNNIDHCARL